MSSSVELACELTLACVECLACEVWFVCAEWGDCFAVVLWLWIEWCELDVSSEIHWSEAGY